MYRTLHLNKIIAVFMLSLVSATVLCCQKSESLTFAEIRTWLRGTHQGTPTAPLTDSYTLNPESPADKPDQYTEQPQGGTDPTANSKLNLTDNAPANNAQGTTATPDPHPPLGVAFTVPTIKPAHFGYPNPGDVPFHVWNPHDGNLNSLPPATMKYAFPGTGAPPSDYVTAASLMTAGERLGQNIIQPSFTTEQAAFQGKMQQAERASGQSSQGSFTSNSAMVRQALINVANEQAAIPLSAGSKDKSLPQAIWMVQQVFKFVFLPMAVLLVLPGAVITQSKGMVQAAFDHSSSPNEDARMPFVGILRALIAIFMIPATQLIISYSIDIGNSLTYEVQNFIDNGAISDWSTQQNTGTPPANAEQEQEQEQRETTGNAMAGSVFNEVNMLLNYGLTVLIAYQVVMMCYLFLMGPIAAAFFAWPASVGRLFKMVLGSWIEAVTNLALWRFWWCIILLCMSTRIHWLQEIGQYNAQDPWEKAVYTSFMVMLTYVPFNPFDFRPGDLVDALLQKAGVKQD